MSDQCFITDAHASYGKIHIPFSQESDTVRGKPGMALCGHELAYALSPKIRYFTSDDIGNHICYFCLRKLFFRVYPQPEMRQYAVSNTAMFRLLRVAGEDVSWDAG